MARGCELALVVKDTGESISISGRFEEEEWELLESFVQYAGDLLNTNLVLAGMSSSLNIRWDQGSGMAIATELPPWDDVTVFLHKFRPIGLQSESTNFYKICSLLAKVLPHPYIQAIIAEQREIYSGGRLQSLVQIRSNDVLLNSEKVLFDWLNSYEYHRDKEKREFIESLHGMFPLEASKAIFLSLLTDKAEAIFEMAKIVRVILGKEKSVRALGKRANLKRCVNRKGGVSSP